MLTKRRRKLSDSHTFTSFSTKGWYEFEWKYNIVIKFYAGSEVANSLTWPDAQQPDRQTHPFIFKDNMNVWCQYLNISIWHDNNVTFTPQAVSAAQRELSGCGERTEEADTDQGDIGEDEAAR